MQKVISTDIKLHGAAEATVWRKMTYFQVGRRLSPLKTLLYPGVTF